MPNPYGAPEISVQEVQRKQQAGEPFLWIDVREMNEVDTVSIPEERIIYLPLSEIAAKKLNALPEEMLDKEAEIVVFCHKGMRSAQVAAWLRQQGWKGVVSMEGGIHAWANEIDPSIGTY